MTLTQLFLEALRLENIWPLLILSLFAYPIIIFLQMGARFITKVFLHYYEWYYLNTKPTKQCQNAEALLRGNFESLEEVRLLKENICESIQSNLVLREKLSAFEDTLSSTIIQQEMERLRKQELKCKAYQYAATLFDVSAPELDSAAVNFETYIKRLPEQSISLSFFSKLISIGNSLDREIVRYNTLEAAKTFLKRSEIEHLKTEFSNPTRLSEGAKKLVANL